MNKLDEIIGGPIDLFEEELDDIGEEALNDPSMGLFFEDSEK